MNFKQYFTESVSWKRKKSRKGVLPMPPLSDTEKELLRQWRHTLKVGDHVDVIDASHYYPGVLVDNQPIKNIEHIDLSAPYMFNNYEIEDLFITAGGLGTNGIDFYPPGYKPGDMYTKNIAQQLSPQTKETFGGLIDEL
jgi:hypothetical protein